MVRIILRCIAFFTLLFLMGAETIIATPPEPDLSLKNNSASTMNSTDSHGTKAESGAIVNVPSKVPKEKGEKPGGAVSGQTEVEKPSGEERKTISNLHKRRSERRSFRKKQRGAKKDQVFCEKTEDDSGIEILDCKNASRAGVRKSDTKGYTILSAPKPVIILPFNNASGQKDLDWLSMGLWDIFAEKLGYAQGFRVIRIRDYITEAGRPPHELSSFDREKAIALARDLSAGQVWTGEFRKASSGNIDIDVKGFNTRSGSEIFEKKLTSTLVNLQFRIDTLIEDLLAELDARQKNNVVNKMRSRYVDNVKAWEHNAFGIEKLLLALLAGKEEKREGLIDESIELHRTSVKEAPGFASGWSGLGWALLEKGDIKGAKKAFNQSVKIKPFFIEGNMGMGYALWEENNVGEAVPFMKEAMNQNPDIEWNRDDMKRTAIRLNLIRNASKKKYHMGGVQIIEP